MATGSPLHSIFSSLTKELQAYFAPDPQPNDPKKGSPSESPSWKETAETIAHWFSFAFVPITAFYCVIRHPFSTMVGFLLAATQKKYPELIEKKIKEIAQERIPYKEKPFGLGSILVDDPEMALAFATFACMMHHKLAQYGLVSYFVYKTTTALLSAAPKETSNDA